MLNRDFFFEFAGMPKSGKTTTLDVIVHFLKRREYRVEEYHGGGRYSPIDKSSLASLNIYLACKAMEFIVTSAEKEKIHSRIFIMDRGLFDRMLFTKALKEMNKINDEEFESISKFLSIPRITSKLDGVFLFTTSPELSIERENKNKLIVKTGRVMNTDFLSMLRRVSLDAVENPLEAFPPATLINTEELDGKIKESAQIIADVIINKIEAVK
jgi:hypothetical protein